MAWVTVFWRFNAPDPEEASRGGNPINDEPSLQFALITKFGEGDEDVRVNTYTTGNLFPHAGVRSDPRRADYTGRVSTQNVPTINNPFFGIVVRAIEEDNSSDKNRKADENDFYDAVDSIARERFRAGTQPTATDLWLAGNSLDLRDRVWRDDDDKVGVSARVYPFFAVDSWPSLLANEGPTRGGGQAIEGTGLGFNFAFTSRSDTHYTLDGNIRYVTNTPPDPHAVVR